MHALFVYGLNVAVTVVCALDELVVIEQVPVPLHPPPDHPVNVEPVFGVAVRVTTVPLANAAEQLLVHTSIPLPGLLVTDPDPVTVTVSKGGSCQLAGGV